MAARHCRTRRPHADSGLHLPGLTRRSLAVSRDGSFWRSSRRSVHCDSTLVDFHPTAVIARGHQLLTNVGCLLTRPGGQHHQTMPGAVAIDIDALHLAVATSQNGWIFPLQVGKSARCGRLILVREQHRDKLLGDGIFGRWTRRPHGCRRDLRVWYPCGWSRRTRVDGRNRYGVGRSLGECARQRCVQVDDPRHRHRRGRGTRSRHCSTPIWSASGRGLRHSAIRNLSRAAGRRSVRGAKASQTALAPHDLEPMSGRWAHPAVAFYLRT